MTVARPLLTATRAFPTSFDRRGGTPVFGRTQKVLVLYTACIGRCMDNSQSNRSEQLPALEVKQSGGFGKRARPYLDVSIPVQLPPRPRQIRPVPRHDDFELGQVVQLAGFL